MLLLNLCLSKVVAIYAEPCPGGWTHHGTSCYSFVTSAKEHWVSASVRRFFMHWLIDWFDSVFTQYWQYFSHITAAKDDQFLNFEVSLGVLISQLFFEIQRNGLLRAKGVVFHYIGHHLTPHPKDIIQCVK